MTLRLGLLIEADATRAKAALGTVSAETAKLKGATAQLGQAADRTEAEVLGLAQAERTAAASTVELSRAQTLAAGSVGNLTSQFNDIGMMLMAGQNPLQLAIQQGTQVAQVIGPMGAGGAVRALGTAFLGMLNPMNLITIGSIAAGAAMIQWLTSAGEEAMSLEDALDAVGSSLDEFTRYSDIARRSTAELRAEFGAYAEEVRRQAAFMAQISLDQSLRDMDAVVGGMSVTFDEVRQSILGVAQAREALAAMEASPLASPEMVLQSREALAVYQDALDATTDRLGVSAGEAVLLDEALQRMDDAEGAGAIAQAADEALRLMEAFRAAGSGGTAEMAALAEAVSGVAEDAREAAIAAGDVPPPLRDAAGSAGELAAAGGPVLSWLSGATAQAGSLAGQLRAAAQAAWTAAQARAATAASARAWVEARQPGGAGREADQRALYGAGQVLARDAQIAAALAPPPPPAVSSGAGAGAGRSAGASAANAEREAVEKLLEKAQAELDLLREGDPIRKELLRNREALAGATAAERAQYELLIATRAREEASMKAATEAFDFFGRAGFDALEALGQKGADLGDVFDDLTQAIIKAALQAAVLGDGPLAGLFGATTPLWQAFLPKFAGGGRLEGPGTGTSDSILMRGSRGEFVVNAAATARHLPLLEAINDGRAVPGFARGGRIGGGGAPSAGAGGREAVEIHVHVQGARGNAEIREMVEQGVATGLGAYDKEILPRRLGQIAADRRRIG